VLSVNAQQASAESWPMFHYDLAHTGYSTNTGHSSNQTLWIFKTDGEVWTSPAVVKGVVYFGSFDQKFYALNAEDGSKIWNFSTGSRMCRLLRWFRMVFSLLDQTTINFMP
jgi:eukaryotic-like serine/threonine-protein kinase